MTHEFTDDPNEFDGKHVLVTGGSKGIGQATVLTTARTQPGGIADASLLVSPPLKAARLGGIDVIVHVVGGSSAPAGGFAVLDDNEWHRALDLNLFPAVRLDRALLPMMLAQGSGVIVHHFDPARDAPARSRHRLCRGEGRPRELQQGFVPGGEPPGHSRGTGFPRLGRDRSRHGFGHELAANKGTDYEGARNILMDSLSAASPSDAPLGRRK